MLLLPTVTATAVAAFGDQSPSRLAAIDEVFLQLAELTLSLSNLPHRFSDIHCWPSAELNDPPGLIAGVGWQERRLCGLDICRIAHPSFGLTPFFACTARRLHLTPTPVAHLSGRELDADRQ